MHRHRGLSRTLPPARVGDCLQPTPAAAATNQLRYPDSSRLVCREDSSSLRSGSPRENLVRSVVARVVSGKPFVPRQQILQVRTVIRELDAMSSGCRLQPHGYQRARDRFPLGAGSKQRRARRRRGAVPKAFFAVGAHLCSLSVRAAAVSPWESAVQSGLAFSERDCRLRMCYSADPRDCQLSEGSRCGQSSPLEPLGAPDPASTRGSQRTLAEPLRKPARQFSVGPEEQRTRRSRRAVLAAFLATRTYL